VSQKYNLAIMARTPRLHQTKTRLVPGLGATGALQAHIELVESTLARLTNIPGVQSSLWVTHLDDVARSWSKTFGLALHLQPPGDLGQKMQQILVQTQAAGAEFACVVGTDCPSINQHYVVQSFRRLESHDVVLGPAEDGGYGLIGVSGTSAGLFDGIDWGTAQVLKQTLALIDQQNLSVALLDEIWDVDSPSDWQRYLQWKALQ
jgi:uncharacterized protein